MARRTVLAADEVAVLKLHAITVQRPCAVAITLVKKGLLDLGSGRYGSYTRITDAGRNALKSMSPGSDRPALAADADSEPVSPPPKRRSSGRSRSGASSTA